MVIGPNRLLMLVLPPAFVAFSLSPPTYAQHCIASHQAEQRTTKVYNPKRPERQDLQPLNMSMPDPYKTSRRDFTRFMLLQTCPDNAKAEYKERFGAVHELLKLLMEHEAMTAVRIEL